MKPTKLLDTYGSGLLLVLAPLLFTAAALFAQTADSPRGKPPQSSLAKPASGDRIHTTCPKSNSARITHSYHPEPPTGPLPATLNPSHFADNKVVFVTYSLAAQIREVLYQ